MSLHSDPRVWCLSVDTEDGEGKTPGAVLASLVSGGPGRGGRKGLLLLLVSVLWWNAPACLPPLPASVLLSVILLDTWLVFKE